MQFLPYIFSFIHSGSCENMYSFGIRVKLYLVCPVLILTIISSVAEANSVTIDEIVVNASAPNTDDTQMDSDARALLSTAGDIGDPLKALLAMPGMSFAGGDFDDPVIRGAGPQDNLYYLNDIPLSNLYHDLSDSFISDLVIRSFDLYSGVAPPDLGSTTGGIINMQLRKPSKERRVVVDLGQIKSGFLFEGALSESVSSYLSIRENLARIFLSSFVEADDYSLTRLPVSRDYTFRLLGESDSSEWSVISLGAYDRANEEQLADAPIPRNTFDEINEQEIVAHSLSFNYSINNFDQIRITAASIDNRISEQIGIQAPNELTEEVHSLRTRFTRDNDSNFQAGINLRKNKYVVQDQNQSFVEAEVYLSREWRLTDLLTATIGASSYYDEFHSQIGIDPTLTVAYQVNPRSEMYFSLGSASKQAATLSQINQSSIWDTVSRDQAEQVNLAWRYDATKNWRLQTELYYKEIEDYLVDQLGLIHHLNGDIVGVDLMLSRWFENGLDGFFSFSVSDNTRTDENERTFDYQYSIPVSMTLALNYQINDHWNISSKFRYQSGQPYTPAEGLIIVPDQEPRIIYGDLLSNRSEDYQRLDIRLEREFSWSFVERASAYIDVLNVLDKNNRYDETPKGVVQAEDGRYLPLLSGEEGLPFVVAIGLRLEF